MYCLFEMRHWLQVAHVYMASQHFCLALYNCRPGFFRSEPLNVYVLVCNTLQLVSCIVSL